MKIIFNETLDRYEAQSSYEERMVPKNARFRWDPDNKVWWTDDESKAVTLIDYADELAGGKLRAYQTLKQKSLDMSSATDSNMEIPAPEGLAYLPYQKAGIAFGLNREATIIGDEMGLGKTIQAIGIMNADPSIKHTLIICPASLRLNWQKEILKWQTDSTKKVGIVNNDWTQATFNFSNIVIMNYDVLHKYYEELRFRTWDLLVVDEFHYLKNYKARRTQMVFGKWNRDPAKAVKPIEAKRKVFLSGTPIPNRPIELWGALNYLDRNTWRSWKYYTERYCAAGYGQYGVDVSGASNLNELQEKLRTSVMVRRLKKDVLKELPAKRRQIIELPMNGAKSAIEAENKTLRANEERLIRLQTAAELAKASDDPTEYERAAQALREAMQMMFTEISRIRAETAIAKIPHVIEHVSNLETSVGKVVVFAHHKEVIRQLKEHFEDKAVVLTGDTPMVARNTAVERFQQDDSVTVFLGTITAAGVGLTLTASSNVVFAELDWVPGNVTQAEDRCHRIGQTDSVTVQHLVIDGSIDAKMVKTIVEKQNIIDAALDGHTELRKTPVIPIPQITKTTRREVEVEAEKLTPEQIEAIHGGLKLLSAMCDGAQAEDGHGFNKFDTMFGKSLAAMSTLTPKQAAIGKNLVFKYRGQLPDELVEIAKGK